MIHTEIENSKLSELNDPDQHRAIFIDDEGTLEQLRRDPRITVIDECRGQQAALRTLVPEVEPELLDEPTRWAYYPWRRCAVHILGPVAFNRLRLDRNRNLISADEQQRLSRQRIGVIGLSVGHAIAYNLATEGLCGEIRLTDFDELELANLNRVPGTVFDLGLNKAVVAARRIAEIDPYIRVHIDRNGAVQESIDQFLDGLDVVVEECDSLDAKVLVREAARARRLPVLMTTSDRGLLDVERFDLEPARPVLHGLLGDIEAHDLAGLSSKDKVPHVLRILDAPQLSPRMAASLVEVGKTLTTWPQLAAEVVLGATVVANAVRRIGLGEPMPSGRVRVDVADALDHIGDPLVNMPAPVHADADSQAEPTGMADILANAATRAPSGGNAQPWHIESSDNRISLRLATKYTTAMDVGYRGSAVALGAAAFNARVAAAAHDLTGQVQWSRGDEGTPLYGVMEFSPGSAPELAELYHPMLARETNRLRGTSEPIATDVLDDLRAAARNEGAELTILDGPAEIETAAGILAETDRIRYLTPTLHREMMSELRWPGDPGPDTGLDVTTLGLDPADMVVLDILRRPEVMAKLSDWNAGTALGDDTYERVTSSSALAVVSVRGHRLTDYALAGSAVEAVWVGAQQHGLAVQPVSPVFLYAHDDRDRHELSPGHADALRDLQYAFRRLTTTERDESQALVLRLSYAPRPTVRSRRRARTGSTPQCG
ncbi:MULTISPECIES: Rv1355c family protein [unclassified Mycolicibacterium]|uniref:Rv1355c family protein n=1 Tax=unclassified Mycolicibacterium TaxID=2636767 RepID=UPI0012DEED6A|nr:MULTISPECIES: Rv1355c family protein [unclassified Mycolicibacterium]MUL80795.1 Rv1355c family protein [Mycolicibacterium sp. CBMA 329]MUL86562.1 Rv1355c family protein [Mycolicibacterium sp. CBMA 331]MUM01423.1 Rv1355c family protein [Mycolicibacterium sp. CBMA 334]MUM27228.1 Rv1355c family protein [Mycolicibacterium sp. CBMA 295]MUM36858.1 Rv1355c family protein [Mycolicibacterium sp. CBMA 247]